MDHVQMSTINRITISCKNIIKSFGTGTAQTKVLRGVDFIAHENEMVMLMGPSGSGKTTLLSIIGGLLKPDSGECLILDKAINSLSEREKTIFRGKSIGFLFQYFNLVPTLNAIENAAIPLILNGTERNKAFEQASTLLKTVGLDQQRTYVSTQLSGGEQQRVSLVRAFIHRPNIILCDEPTSFLDHERGKQIMELLRAIQKENNCTVIVVTHDPRILEFADRIVTIEDGMIKQGAQKL